MRLAAVVERFPLIGFGHERVSRSVMKTALYRVFMIAISITVAFVFTGEVGSALGIGLTTNAVKTVTYFGYERLWTRVDWGYDGAAEDAAGPLHHLVEAAKRHPDADRAGAIVTFTGRVREHDRPDDVPTTALEFERHPALTDERLADIADELTARDGVHDVSFHHEDGHVEAGGDAVHVVALGRGRDETFQAARDGIDRLKAEAPIFKKEITVEDEYWVDGRHEAQPCASGDEPGADEVAAD